MTQSIWCDSCYTWVDDFEIAEPLNDIVWVCCSACHNGLVMSVDDTIELNTEKKNRIALAKAIWGLI